MIYDIAQDSSGETTLVLTPEFIAELKAIIERQRELNRNAAVFHENMERESRENSRRLEALEQKLTAMEKVSQARG